MHRFTIHVQPHQDVYASIGLGACQGKLFHRSPCISRHQKKSCHEAATGSNGAFYGLTSAHRGCSEPQHQERSQGSHHRRSHLHPHSNQHPRHPPRQHPCLRCDTLAPRPGPVSVRSASVQQRPFLLRVVPTLEHCTLTSSSSSSSRGRRLFPMAQVAAVGRALLSPFTGFSSWYNRTAQAHPFTTGIITTGVKTSAADAFAQKVVEKRDHMDWTRHAVFCTFGFAYLGAFQYWLYNVKFTQWCGPITARFGHRGSAPIKVLIDQGLHHPLIYFPTFFSMKAAVSGQPLSSAVDKYKSEIWDSLKALWGVWVPAQLFNFSFVPRHLRIPYVAAVSFGWTVILSVMQGKFDAAKLQKQQHTAAALGASAAAAVSAKAAAGSPPGQLPSSGSASVVAAARQLPSTPVVAAAVARTQQQQQSQQQSGAGVEEA